MKGKKFLNEKIIYDTTCRTCFRQAKRKIHDSTGAGWCYRHQSFSVIPSGEKRFYSINSTTGKSWRMPWIWSGWSIYWTVRFPVAISFSFEHYCRRHRLCRSFHCNITCTAQSCYCCWYHSWESWSDQQTQISDSGRIYRKISCRKRAWPDSYTGWRSCLHKCWLYSHCGTDKLRQSEKLFWYICRWSCDRTCPQSKSTCDHGHQIHDSGRLYRICQKEIQYSKYHFQSGISSWIQSTVR